ncbi:hypothetical protein EVAR_53807_1 [Eumeta japonica]|uniref:Uncharacterized protein n=1 Tax=Eumeta variegata TaxID=151549 RepID=A0A4C1XV83_EUMVA|nr:hypothetical protein EVAR_53807_1 [Eumeta japonica]
MAPADAYHDGAAVAQLHHIRENCVTRCHAMGRTGGPLSHDSGHGNDGVRGTKSPRFRSLATLPNDLTWQHAMQAL